MSNYISMRDASMHPAYAQILCRLEDSLITIVDSGREGAKTTTVAQHGILQCISKVYKIVVFVPFATQVKGGIGACFEKWLSDWNLTRYVTAKNKDRIEISCNGHRSTIWFKYGNTNPEAACKAIEGMDLAIVDEAQLFVNRFFDFLIGTIREKKVRVIATCNLTDPSTWAYKMTRGGEMQELNDSYYNNVIRPVFIEKGKIPPYKYLIGRVYMPWYLNPYLSDESRGKIMAYAKSSNLAHREKYYIEYMNEVRTKSQHLIYPPGLFLAKKFEVTYDYMGRPMYEGQYIKFLYGLDFGVTSNGAIVQIFIHYHRGMNKFGKIGQIKDLYIRKVICKPMPFTEEYLERAMNWMPEIFNEDELSLGVDDKGVSDDKSDIVRQLGSGYVGYPPLRAFSAEKGAGSIYRRIMYIRGFNKVFYSPECENCFHIPGRLHCDNIYQELINYKWDIDKDTDDIKYSGGKEVPKDEYNHIMDAIGYALQPVQKLEEANEHTTHDDENEILQQMAQGNESIYFDV